MVFLLRHRLLFPDELVVLSGLVRKAGLRLCLKIFVPHLLFPVFEVSGIGT